jgi:transcriptional regulator with XRE-family HTH domain
VIKAMRVSRGLTQRQLCKDTGLSPAKYGAMETRKIPVSYETLQALSKYYDVPISQLI